MTPSGTTPLLAPGLRHSGLAPVRVGLVGPRNAVRDLAEAARATSPDTARFVTFVCDDPVELAERWNEALGAVQAVVFPGPWHHDRVRELRNLTIPTVHVPVSAEALYVALLHATEDRIDLETVSIDSMPEDGIREAYDELGLASDRVAIRPYVPGTSPEDLLEFHRRQAAAGSALAVTSFFPVERQLRADGIPVRRMQPTRATLRHTLHTATLLARGRRLYDHQIAMVAVQLPAAGDGVPSGPSNYSQQEVGLSVHRVLLDQARRAGAVVVRRTDALFLVTVTRGGLDELTGHLRNAPFIATCRDALGLDLCVGVGLGTSAQLAERHALAGAEHAAVLGPGTGVLVDTRGGRRAMDPNHPVTDVAPVSERTRDLLDRLVRARPATGGPGALTVGVDEVAAILAVTPRSARRICKSLVEAGLAWPTPPIRSANGGRPRQQFQLLADKIA